MAGGEGGWGSGAVEYWVGAGCEASHRADGMALRCEGSEFGKGAKASSPCAKGRATSLPKPTSPPICPRGSSSPVHGSTTRACVAAREMNLPICPFCLV